MKFTSKLCTDARRHFLVLSFAAGFIGSVYGEGRDKQVAGGSEVSPKVTLEVVRVSAPLLLINLRGEKSIARKAVLRLANQSKNSVKILGYGLPDSPSIYYQLQKKADVDSDWPAPLVRRHFCGVGRRTVVVAPNESFKFTLRISSKLEGVKMRFGIAAFIGPYSREQVILSNVVDLPIENVR